MQIRIWAELVVSGLPVYTGTSLDLDDSPQNNSMFERAGAGGKAAKSHGQGDSSVTKAFAEAASAMSALYSTPTSKASQPSSYSPARVIESRFKLYNQLTELQNLKVQVFWMVWNIKKEKENDYEPS